MIQEVIKMPCNGQATIDELERLAEEQDEILVPSATLLDLIRRVKAQEPQEKPKCPAEEIIALYHEMMPDNPKVKVINAARRSAIRARWREAASLTCKPFGYSNRQDGLNAWREFFAVCAESDFLTGRVPPRPGYPAFVADIDFIMRPSGFASIIENKYHREIA